MKSWRRLGENRGKRGVEKPSETEETPGRDEMRRDLKDKKGERPEDPSRAETTEAMPRVNLAWDASGLLASDVRALLYDPSGGLDLDAAFRKLRTTSDSSSGSPGIGPSRSAYSTLPRSFGSPVETDVRGARSSLRLSASPPSSFKLPEPPINTDVRTLPNSSQRRKGPRASVQLELGYLAGVVDNPEAFAHDTHPSPLSTKLRPSGSPLEGTRLDDHTKADFLEPRADSPNWQESPRKQLDDILQQVSTERLLSSRRKSVQQPPNTVGRWVGKISENWARRVDPPGKRYESSLVKSDVLETEDGKKLAHILGFIASQGGDPNSLVSPDRNRGENAEGPNNKDTASVRIIIEKSEQKIFSKKYNIEIRKAYEISGNDKNIIEKEYLRPFRGPGNNQENYRNIMAKLHYVHIRGKDSSTVIRGKYGEGIINYGRPVTYKLEDGKEYEVDHRGFQRIENSQNALRNREIEKTAADEEDWKAWFK